MHPYLLTASEALGRLKDGSLTVEAYAQSVLSRIERRNDAVRAWAYLDPGYVLAEARRLDAIPAESRGPLHGVAVAVKDVIQTKDMPTQHGSEIYKDDAPQVDAASIRILRHAGALLLGKTMTTPFASTQGGPATRNPHDPARTPGGSSSGSAAAVGDFQAPLALGTQTGGSTIRPASFNGIYGLKPTWNSVNREGQKIHSLILDTTGFFARSVGDLALLADVFGLFDDVPPIPVSIKGAKFGFLRTVVWPAAGPGMIAAMDRAAELLRAHGAECEEVQLPVEFDKLPRWHEIIFEVDGSTAFLPEYRTDKEKLPSFLADHVENRHKISHAEEVQAFDAVAALRPKMDEILRQYTAIITPSVIDEAPLGQKETGKGVFNTMWTVLHQPVVNIPGFQGDNSLPIGLSLVAPRFHDRRLLAVSREVGAIFESEGGWKRRVADSD